MACQMPASRVGAGTSVPCRKPTRHRHGLAERAQAPGTAWGADPTASGRQPGLVLNHGTGGVEHGMIGNQRKACGQWLVLVVKRAPARGFVAFRGRWRSVPPTRSTSLMHVLPWCVPFNFAEKTSLRRPASGQLRGVGRLLRHHRSGYEDLRSAAAFCELGIHLP